jgi:hypothetical protein
VLFNLFVNGLLDLELAGRQERASNKSKVQDLIEYLDVYVKWAEMLCRVRGMEVSSKYLLTYYVKNPFFDPDGFFFLTHRSNTVGTVLAWKNTALEPSIIFLCPNNTPNRKVPHSYISLFSSLLKRHFLDSF